MAAVAREAGVSRQTVYQHHDLLDQVKALRAETVGRSGPAVPVGQRATTGSLQAQLQAAKAEIQRLRQENASLRAELAGAREQVAHALGRDF